MQRIMTTNTGQGYQSCLEPATGVEPAADTVLQTAALPLSYADHVPGFRRAEKRGKKVIARFRAGASAGL